MYVIEILEPCTLLRKQFTSKRLNIGTIPSKGTIVSRAARTYGISIGIVL
jgi:hypothetical protein